MDIAYEFDQELITYVSYTYQARSLGKRVIDRCNLVVLFENGQEDLVEFLADHQVQVVASLPCYTEENTDKQRGKHVHQDR